ncbi:MAG TPA: hypothetical protein VEK33_12155 [Terriglobales bacterium]|nr:hypothetical protein [Terriglobales bacterium]
MSARTLSESVAMGKTNVICAILGAPAGANLVEDPKWEFAILATVQGFYEKLLEQSVGGEVPVPAGLEAGSLQADDQLTETLSLLHRWLRLLELAITPAMLRRALTPETDPEIAEAVLRYYTRHKDASDRHRDKTDVVTTFLYRHPRVPGQWERRGYGLDGALPPSPFEIALMEILADTEGKLLSEVEAQKLREFEQWQQQAENFQDLSALLESQIIPRVRDCKRSFGVSFYHPAVLATIAAYNTVFGKIFDRLFLDATMRIKELADELSELGGTILGAVDGVDVTVEQVAEFQETELLRADYATARETFQRISKLRKALQQRPPMRRWPRPAPSPEIRATPAPSVRPLLDMTAMRRQVTPQQISTEEVKLCRVEESIRVFVRVANPKFRQVVPMRFFNLVLTPAEAQAYGADYLEENSVRAAVARAQLRMVAVVARITSELGELRRAELSPSLWKLHADALIVLLEIERTLREDAAGLIPQERRQEFAGDEQALEASRQKLKDCARLAVETLCAQPGELAAAAAGAQ